MTAVIAMAKSLKLRVIAEGPETAEEVAFLRAHHCDEAQGHYFSQPVPSEQFAKLLETGISRQNWAPGRAGRTKVGGVPGAAQRWPADVDSALADIDPQSILARADGVIE